MHVFDAFSPYWSCVNKPKLVHQNENNVTTVFSRVVETLTFHVSLRNAISIKHLQSPFRFSHINLVDCLKWRVRCIHTGMRTVAFLQRPQKKSSAISNFHIRDKAIRMLSKTLSIGMPVRNDFISNLMMFNGLIDAIPVSLAMDYRFSSREC